MAVAVLILLAVTATMPAYGARTRITFSCGSAQQNTLAKLVEEFNKANADVTVELLVQPAVSSQMLERLIPIFAAQDPSIDVLYMDVIWPGVFAANGWVEPLDRYFAPETRAGFIPGTVKSAMYKGSVYGVPLFTDGGLLYYRKDLLDKYGLKEPSTWDDLVKACQVVLAGENDPNLEGFLFQAKTIEGATCNLLEYLWSLGYDVLDDNNALILDRGALEKALQMMHDMVYRHKVSPKAVATYVPDDCRLAFRDGRAVFMRNWTFAYASLQQTDSRVRGKVAVTALPHAPGQTSASTLGGWMIGISRYSRNKDAAWRFVEYVTGFEAQKRLALYEATVPTRLKVYEDPEVLDKMPWMAEFGKGLVNNLPRPVHPQYLEMSGIMQPEINACISGMKSPAEAADAIMTALKKIVK